MARNLIMYEKNYLVSVSCWVNRQFFTSASRPQPDKLQFNMGSEFMNRTDIQCLLIIFCHTKNHPVYYIPQFKSIVTLWWKFKPNPLRSGLDWWVALKCNTLQSNGLHISDPRIVKNTFELDHIRIFSFLEFILAKLWQYIFFNFDKGNVAAAMLVHVGWTDLSTNMAANNSEGELNLVCHSVSLSNS